MLKSPLNSTVSNPTLNTTAANNTPMQLYAKTHKITIAVHLVSNAIQFSAVKNTRSSIWLINSKITLTPITMPPEMSLSKLFTYPPNRIRLFWLSLSPAWHKLWTKSWFRKNRIEIGFRTRLNNWLARNVLPIFLSLKIISSLVLTILLSKYRILNSFYKIC